MINGGGQSHRAGRRFAAMFDQEGHALIDAPIAPETEMITIPFQNGGSIAFCQGPPDVSESPKSDRVLLKADHLEEAATLLESCADEIQLVSELIFRFRPRSRLYSSIAAHLHVLKSLEPYYRVTIEILKSSAA
jgi:hypothetical protein